MEALLAIGALFTAIGLAFAGAARRPTVKPSPEGEPDGQPLEGRNPRGFGLAIRSLNHTRFLPGTDKRYDAQALIDFCQAIGCRWVAIEFAKVRPDGSMQKYGTTTPKARAVVEQLKAAGIQVGIWGWPDPAGEAKFLAEMDAAIANLRPSFLKFNPEEPYHGADNDAPFHTFKQRAASARRIMQHAGKYGLPIIISTYGGGPKSHPSFPWAAWAEGAAIGQPQWYDTKHKWTDASPRKFYEGWAPLFPRIDPIIGGSNAHTPEDMEREANEQLGWLRPQAYAIWDFYWLAIAPARAAAAGEIAALYGQPD